MSIPVSFHLPLHCHFSPILITCERKSIRNAKMSKKEPKMS